MVGKKDKSFTLEWRVVSLSGTSDMPKDVIRIEGMKFKEVRKTVRLKGYRRLSGQGAEIRYSQPSVRGLMLAINESQKSIRAIAPGESSLAQVANDFDLPMYRST